MLKLASRYKILRIEVQSAPKEHVHNRPPTANRGALIWRVFLRRASYYVIFTNNRVVSVRVKGTRTHDLARAEQPFPLDH